MKARELRDLSDDGLRDRIATARRDVFGLRMEHAPRRDRERAP